MFGRHLGGTRLPAVLTAAAITAASPATAQTLTIRSVKDATIRGGSYASKNFGDSPILETRQSSDPSYVRRAVLTFDTQVPIPANAKIASAKLVLTVKSGNPQARTLNACTVPISFDEPAVTWQKRKPSNRWTHAGGDIISTGCSRATVTASANSKVTFDVTAQVQRVVKGNYGSRYARFLVGDVGGASRDSYKEYYSNNAAATSLQPTLIVQRGTSGAPPSDVQTTSTSTLRVLQWNTHHGGFGTDGRYDPNRVATWIASTKPDVVMLNEIERYTGWGNQNQPEVYRKLLQSKTGKSWHYVFAQEFGNWSAHGKGNLILTSVPMRFVDRHELVHNSDRSVAEAMITWKGRPITLILTHLDPDSPALRLTQATEVTNWSAAEPENKILTGDMNAWPDQTSIAHFNKYFYDSWSVAASKGEATAFAGNAGQTKNGRIDYIYYSKRSPNLRVRSSRVIDTRASNGVMPSDHRPVLTVFEVR
jgi:endonuclease/exonuclease/phosphatase family metal-dependent hydrolase